MASYHDHFEYNGADSASDKGLIIVAFEPDDGFKETFLTMDVISDEYYDGSKKINYGSKYNTTAQIEIQLIKANGEDISLKDFRDYARWLTGARKDSWLDFYSGGTFQYSFLGRVTDLQQYKLDGRTVGIKVVFSSVTPWAFSAEHHLYCTFGQKIKIDSNGILSAIEESAQPLYIDKNGILYSGVANAANTFSFIGNKDDGIIYVDNTTTFFINNETDDQYTYINLDMVLNNKDCDYLSVKNTTLKEESLVKNMSDNETITLSAKQFITSSIPKKIFGDDFNFVWPRLAPGDNEIAVSGSGSGSVEFYYRYPMKVGDCAMDIDVHGGGTSFENCIDAFTYDA